jgi:hypothetical protein
MGQPPAFVKDTTEVFPYSQGRIKTVVIGNFNVHDSRLGQQAAF